MQNTLTSILVGICLGVAIGMRIEVGVIGLVFIGLCLYLRCTARHVILLMLVTGLTALLLTAQTLFVNEIPGSGEHLLALAMNLSLDDYWAPYSGLMLVYLSFHVVLRTTKPLRILVERYILFVGCPFFLVVFQ